MKSLVSDLISVGKIMTATVKFQKSSNLILSGCSQSGKSVWAKNFILNAKDLFEIPPTVCVFVYTHRQPIYDEIQKAMGDKIIFTEQLPSEEDLAALMANHDHGMFIADDKAGEIGTNKFFYDLLTRMAHHLRLSTLLIVQDAALNGKLRSSILKNTHVNIVMRSPRERMYLRNLAIMLNDYKCVMEAYDDCMKEPYSYLIIDTHPNSCDEYRYRSKIFKHDGPCVVYRRREKNVHNLQEGPM